MTTELSTGLTGKQIDDLREAIYDVAVATGKEGSRLTDELVALRSGDPRRSDLSTQCDKLYAKADGLYAALNLLDNARRSARLAGSRSV